MIVAIFGALFWEWILRPRLVLSVRVERPDAVKTILTNTATGEKAADCYYFRIAVQNKGYRRAENVEVYAEELTREVHGLFQVVTDFPPMDLVWSHLGQRREISIRTRGKA